MKKFKERQWASPYLGVPKKGSNIGLIIHFHELNQVIKQQEYPLPTIDEMFQNICGFTFASVTDLNMGHLSILLTEPTQKLLTIINLFGYFEWFVLAM